MPLSLALLTALLVILYTTSSSCITIPEEPTFQWVNVSNTSYIETYGSSLDLPAIYNLVEAPGAWGIQTLSTPWPFIVGQSIFSVLLYWFSIKNDDNAYVPKELLWAFKFFLNNVRTFGGIVYLVVYLLHGGTFPSIGIILMFEGLLVCAYPPKITMPTPPLASDPESRNPSDASESRNRIENRVRNYIYLCQAAHLVVVIGCLLYILTGAIQFKNHGLNNASIHICVNQGCPNGTTDVLFGPGIECSDPAPYCFANVTDSDVTNLVFWGLGSLLGLVNAFVGFQTLIDFKKRVQLQQRQIYGKIGFEILAIGVLLAIAGAGAGAGSYSTQYYDCSHVKQISNGNWTGCIEETIVFPGSPSGYWDVWVSFNEAVLEGVFAW